MTNTNTTITLCTTGASWPAIPGGLPLKESERRIAKRDIARRWAIREAGKRFPEIYDGKAVLIRLEITATRWRPAGIADVFDTSLYGTPRHPRRRFRR